jgi:hypothetical protein
MKTKNQKPNTDYMTAEIMLKNGVVIPVQNIDVVGRDVTLTPMFGRHIVNTEGVNLLVVGVIRVTVNDIGSVRAAPRFANGDETWTQVYDHNVGEDARRLKNIATKLNQQNPR